MSVVPRIRVVVWMRQTGKDRVAVVESGDDESLKKNTTACFVKTTSYLSNSSKVEKACSDHGGDMLWHV